MAHKNAQAKTNANTKEDVVVIKKYANRRLYNTETSTYVTLEDLRQMLSEGRNFTVSDAKTGEDITRSILTQIIFDMENKEGFLLSEDFLISLIRFYDDTIKEFIPPYLETSMQTFITNQEQMRGMVKNAVGTFNPLQPFEEMKKQNMEFFTNAMQMFNPFAAGVQGDEKK